MLVRCGSIPKGYMYVCHAVWHLKTGFEDWVSDDDFVSSIVNIEHGFEMEQPILKRKRPLSMVQFPWTLDIQLFMYYYIKKDS